MKPKKLFISYPSESWNFAQRIAENLAQRLEESIFIDYRSIDQADFAESIVSHLRASDGVILVVTDFTFADIHRDNDWVRLEIRTALENNIPIVLVRENGLLPPRDLPEDVRGVSRSQGVPFYREFFEPGIVLLCEFLIRINVATTRVSGTPTPIIQPTPAPGAPTQAQATPQRAISGQASIDEAIVLLEDGDYEKALVILETLHEKGGLRTVAAKLVADLVAQAQTMSQNAARRREAELDYQTISLMAQRTLTEANARAAFADWCQAYPDLVEALDTQDLAKPYGTAMNRQRTQSRSLDLLPQPFDWIEIPAGQVTLVTEKGWAANYIPEGQSRTFDVPAFAIAKYPVTNAQYRLFVDAGGYSQHRWWTEAGWEAKAKGWALDSKKSNWDETNQPWTQPRHWNESQWNGEEHPVVGVSWYEAVAYCLWLSDLTGEQIMLPAEQQWQRAAQGDDDRTYPWGNDWDCQRCNNSVKPCSSDRTTPVIQYADKGGSAFGVVDMAGNVWEWCATDYDNGKHDINSIVTDRALRGGSWWGYGTDYIRCGFRNWFNPHVRNFDVGFRLSLS